MGIKEYFIRKVAVLGSGVMGSQIAAHCANAGLEVLLLDLKSEKSNNPNEIADSNLKKILKMKPAPFAVNRFAKRVNTGNFEDDWNQLKSVDWIIEAVVERMDIKKDIMKRIDGVRDHQTIVSTNTSGLPIHEISADCSDDFQRHFMGTHFFNPPRYMKLLEVIPTPKTEESVTTFMTDFIQRFLGKGVVECNDTPNFIANRIGIFSMASIMPWAFSKKLRFEEIDYLTGTFTGYSKAATFRTADMAGLDVIAHVAHNLYPNIPDDERKEVFKLHSKFEEMVEKGMHGNKTGHGFYKKNRTDSGTQYLVTNPETLEYEAQREGNYPSVTEANKTFHSAGERLKFMINQDDDAGWFLWEIHRDLFLYSANRIPEITQSIESIDRAMKWGFNWELGPFEKWDAIGVRDSVERMEKEGYEVPESVREMLATGRESFYDPEKGSVYNLATGEIDNMDLPAPGSILIKGLQSTNREVISKNDAALYDMGDGVALFEFRSKANTLGREVIETLFESFEKVKNDFDALVIGNDGDNFSVGANLGEVLIMLREGKFDVLEDAIKSFQQASMGIRYLPVPVVAAPYNRTLGGGCEFTLHADRVVAHHELYAGLVEVGVGLIPAGGGTKEMLRRAVNRIPDDASADSLLYLKEVFQTIGMAKVSMSAREAKDMHFLNDDSRIVMNRDLLLRAAKKEARLLAEQGYLPPVKATVKLLGKTAYSALKLSMYIMQESRFISEYDAKIGEKLAYVLTGGDLTEPQEVSEEYILKLEREAFLELLHEKKTQDRIEYTLKKGKPLRN